MYTKTFIMKFVNLVNFAKSKCQNSQSLCFTKPFCSTHHWWQQRHNNNYVFNQPQGWSDDFASHWTNHEAFGTPIHIKNISNYSTTNKVFTNITDLNSFTCRSTPSNIIIQPVDHQNFNKIIDHLHETNACFHSYNPVTFAHTESSSGIYNFHLN